MTSLRPTTSLELNTAGVSISAATPASTLPLVMDTNYESLSTLESSQGVESTTRSMAPAEVSFVTPATIDLSQIAMTTFKASIYSKDSLKVSESPMISSFNLIPEFAASTIFSRQSTTKSTSDHVSLSFRAPTFVSELPSSESTIESRSSTEGFSTVVVTSIDLGWNTSPVTILSSHDRSIVRSSKQLQLESTSGSTTVSHYSSSISYLQNSKASQHPLDGYEFISTTSDSPIRSTDIPGFFRSSESTSLYTPASASADSAWQSESTLLNQISTAGTYLPTSSTSLPSSDLEWAESDGLSTSSYSPANLSQLKSLFVTFKSVSSPISWPTLGNLPTSLPSALESASFPPSGISPSTNTLSSDVASSLSLIVSSTSTIASLRPQYTSPAFVPSSSTFIEPQQATSRGDLNSSLTSSEPRNFSPSSDIILNTSTIISTDLNVLSSIQQSDALVTSYSPTLTVSSTNVLQTEISTSLLHYDISLGISSTSSNSMENSEITSYSSSANLLSTTSEKLDSPISSILQNNPDSHLLGDSTSVYRSPSTSLPTVITTTPVSYSSYTQMSSTIYEDVPSASTLSDKSSSWTQSHSATLMSSPVTEISSSVISLMSSKSVSADIISELIHSSSKLTYSSRFLETSPSQHLETILDTKSLSSLSNIPTTTASSLSSRSPYEPATLLQTALGTSETVGPTSELLTISSSLTLQPTGSVLPESMDRLSEEASSSLATSLAPIFTSKSASDSVLRSSSVLYSSFSPTTISLSTPQMSSGTIIGPLVGTSTTASVNDILVTQVVLYTSRTYLSDYATDGITLDTLDTTFSTKYTSTESISLLTQANTVLESPSSLQHVGHSLFTESSYHFTTSPALETFQASTSSPAAPYQTPIDPSTKILPSGAIINPGSMVVGAPAGNFTDTAGDGGPLAGFVSYSISVNPINPPIELRGIFECVGNCSSTAFDGPYNYAGIKDSTCFCANDTNTPLLARRSGGFTPELYPKVSRRTPEETIYIYHVISLHPLNIGFLTKE